MTLEEANRMLIWLNYKQLSGNKLTIDDMMNQLTANAVISRHQSEIQPRLLTKRLRRKITSKLEWRDRCRQLSCA